MNHLRGIADRIVSTRNEQQLATLVMDVCPAVFEAQNIGITLFDQPAAAPKVETTRASERFLDQYQRHLRSIDPLLKCVLERHRAVRDLDVISHEHWLQFPLYTDIAVPFGM